MGNAICFAPNLNWFFTYHVNHLYEKPKGEFEVIGVRVLVGLYTTIKIGLDNENYENLLPVLST